MTKLPAKRTFGVALCEARALLRLDRWAAAKACSVLPRTISRWEADECWPSLESRHELLHLFIDLPWPKLRELAELADTTLAHAGIQTIPNPENEARPVAASGGVPTPSAQSAVDHAIREAAEDLGIHARDLRPVASRLLDAIAKSGVSVDVAARMVIGIPKRPETPKTSAAPQEPSAR